jgi:hypothetical protein
MMLFFLPTLHHPKTMAQQSVFLLRPEESRLQMLSLIRSLAE